MSARANTKQQHMASDDLPPLRRMAPRRLAAWARGRRAALGLTIDQLARRARVQVEDVWLIEERGQIDGSSESRALSRAYGVPALVLEVWLGYVRSSDVDELVTWLARRRT